MGGEEFVVLLPATDVAGAGAFADRIRAGLATQPTPDVPTPDLPTVHVSAGVVSSVSPDDLTTLLHRADDALYAAKRAGRDRTMTWLGSGEQRAAA